MMKLSEINIRDPFILPYEGKYYMYCKTDQNQQLGFAYYVSADLENWAGPESCFVPPAGFWSDREFWAPEVHAYQGSFYLFAGFRAEGKMRTVQLLKAEKPWGPFEVWSEPVTPQDQMCLDGTFYIENRVPYMIYCHEWVQCTDGEMWLVQLADDLKSAVGKPKMLFAASQSGWANGLAGTPDNAGIITDGPFVHQNKDGHLVMTWSSFCNNLYAVGIAVSESGSAQGPWKHCPEPALCENGGHGMMFRTFEGDLLFVLHKPNSPAGKERAHLYRCVETDTFPYLRFLER